MIKFPDALTARTANPTHPLLGRGVDRVDGPAKVTGAARYAAEYPVDALLFGHIVSSAIAKGRIASIDISAAMALPGVLRVFSHKDRPSLAWFDRKWKDDDAPSGSPFRPLYDDEVMFSEQPIALVVAETTELARHAATLVRVTYKTAEHATDLRKAHKTAREPSKGKSGFEPPPKARGDAAGALKEAPVQVAVDYVTAPQHHNPMEMFATTVACGADGKLTVYDKTQGVVNVHTYLHTVFGLASDEARVVSPYVGGGFGSGLRPQHQLFMAVLAATALKRSVQVSLTRQQMFSFGHRPETLHHIRLGAELDGRLKSIVHECESETSRFEDYTEVVVNWSGLLYQCDNVRLAYKVVPLDVYTPLDMRAPGATPGVFALECAIDELAYAVRMDPLALRLKNYAERDQNQDKPFSSKELRACFAQGAARFGWEARSAEPRSMRDGRLLIGWGMACGVWDAMQKPASAKAVLGVDGRLVVCSATSDIGTGTYTVMTQIAADALGLRIEEVEFQLGDSSMPEAPLEGGSFTVSSVGTAVKGACDRVADRLVGMARRSADYPAFHGVGRADVTFADGCIQLRADSTQRVPLVTLMRISGATQIDETAKALPNLLKQRGYTMSTHSAVFVEVAVDDLLGTVAVRRVVSAVAGGRIINTKTARSQIVGGVVWGIGMALQEATEMDDALGRYMNHSLAEYHIPVHADIPADIDVIFVEEHDDIVNPLGAKGLGEIGLVGVAAAVGNAVFHATGRRIRELPITLDKVMAPPPGVGFDT